MGNAISSVCVPLLHWMRLFGWAPWLLYALVRWPLRTLLGMAFYYGLLSRLPLWRDLLKRFARAGLDPRFHLVRHDLALGKPIDTTKRYLICVHPHGVYCDGVLYSIVFQKDEFERQIPGMKYVGAGADQVSYIPLFRELLGGDKGGLIGVSKKELLGLFQRDPKVSIGMCPGGFSEAVFSDARNKCDYSYLKGRKGFVKLAIQAGVDIIPIYQFGVCKLYKTPRSLRGLRARLAQALAMPMVIWWGWWGTNQPLDDSQVYTVFGAPFPASQYTLAEIDKAHADYLAALQQLYDQYKDQCGMGDKPLVFIGKDFFDSDLIPQLFRRLGVHTSHVVPNQPAHRDQLRVIREARKKREEWMRQAGQTKVEGDDSEEEE